METSDTSSEHNVSEETHKNVLVETSTGAIVLELYWNESPRTCNNFWQLSNQGRYDNCIFHRVIRDFVIQGGDPTGTGRGGTSIYGGYFEDEVTKKLKHTGAGILCMANAGPNTNGSQFFITLAPLPHLDGKHSIFGRVLKGMTVVQRMAAVETDKNNRPMYELKILKARPCK